MAPIFIPRVVVSICSETDDLVESIKEYISYQSFKDFVLFVKSDEINNLGERQISNTALSFEERAEYELPGQKGGVFQYLVFIVTTNVESFKQKFPRIKETCDIEHAGAAVFYFLINGTDKPINLNGKERVDSLLVSRKLSNAQTMSVEKQREKLFNLLGAIISLDIPVDRLRQVLFSSSQTLSCNIFSVTEPPRDVLEYLSLLLKSKLFSRLTVSKEKDPVNFESFSRKGFFKGSKEFLNRPIALRFLQFRPKRRSLFKKWKREINASINANKQKYYGQINPKVESIRQRKFSIKKNLADKTKKEFFSSFSVHRLVCFLEDLKSKIEKAEHEFNWFFFRLHLDRIRTLFFPWSVVGAGITALILAIFVFVGIKINFIYLSMAAGFLVAFLGYSIFIKFKATKLKQAAEDINDSLLSSIEINTNNYFKAVNIADLELLKDAITNKLFYFKPILSLYNSHLEAINKRIEETQENQTVNQNKIIRELIHSYIDAHFNNYFKGFSDLYSEYLWNSLKKPSDIENIFLRFLFESNFFKFLMEFVQKQLPEYDKFKRFRDEYNISPGRKIFCYEKASLLKQLIIYPTNEDQPENFNECLFERTYLDSHWYYIYTGEIQ